MSIYPITDFLTSGTVSKVSTLDDPESANSHQSQATPSVAATALAVAPKSPAKTPPPAPDPTVKKVVDTVKLSEDAQIELLTQRGQTPSEIANALGLPLSTINIALYISTAPATVPAALLQQSSPLVSYSPVA